MLASPLRGLPVEVTEKDGITSFVKFLCNHKHQFMLMLHDGCVFFSYCINRKTLKRHQCVEYYTLHHLSSDPDRISFDLWKGGDPVESWCSIAFSRFSLVPVSFF